jgi:hypothetical protein
MACGSHVGSASDVVVRPMVFRQTRPMRVSELRELTGPHRTPQCGAFDEEHWSVRCELN